MTDMVDLPRVNNGDLSDSLHAVVERVAVDGFLLNYGVGKYATAAGRKVPGTIVGALQKRGYVTPNDDVLLPGIEPQTLIPGPLLTARGVKHLITSRSTRRDQAAHARSAGGENG